MNKEANEGTGDSSILAAFRGGRIFPNGYILIGQVRHLTSIHSQHAFSSIYVYFWIDV